MSELDSEWIASEYFDDGRWGILTSPGNAIVIGVSVGLTREMAVKIAQYHNERHLGKQGK